jgi:hypothetical protein
MMVSYISKMSTVFLGILYPRIPVPTHTKIMYIFEPLDSAHTPHTILVRLYACTFVRLYVCTFVRLYVCTFVRLYACTLVRLYACTRVRTVEVQHLTVVIAPLLPLEPRRRQLSPIRLWLRQFPRTLYTVKFPYENYSSPGLLFAVIFALITSFSTTPICPHLTHATQLH